MTSPVKSGMFVGCHPGGVFKYDTDSSGLKAGGEAGLRKSAWGKSLSEEQDPEGALEKLAGWGREKEVEKVGVRSKRRARWRGAQG